MTATITAYTLISGGLDNWLKRTASRPDVANESRFYLEQIGSIRSAKEFVQNDRVFTFAMKAFGLGDMAYAKAFVRKMLDEGVDAPSALANRLADNRYRDFVEAFNFAHYGEATMAFDRTQQGTVDRYVRQSLEETVGADNEGVRLALYFARKAADIKGPFDILSDRALTQVVYTALGLSSATSRMDIDAQARLISGRLDLQSLQTPEALNKFIARFAALSDAKAGAQASSGGLLLSSRPQQTFGIDLLVAMQSFRTGR